MSGDSGAKPPSGAGGNGAGGQDLLIGVDVGTYSSKGVLVNLAGEILRQKVVPHGVSMPAPGHVEQDADAVWWADVQEIVRDLLSGGVAERVAGVALSAIGPTLLPLDAAGRPLRPGILYGVDIRAQDQIAALEAELGADTIFDHHTGAHSMPLHDPQARASSGRFAGAVLGDKGLDALPRLAWSDEVAGHVTPEAAALTGLRAGTPVAVGTVDALSEAISVGVTQPGDLMVMYGSTTFFVLVQDAPTPDPRVWSVGGAFAGQVNLAAGMGTTGSLTRWFVDEFARELPTGEAYDELFAQAGALAPGADGLLMLPYFSGERTPINDPQARGVVAGLTLSHRREHLFRAALEGVGFGVRHNIGAFRDLGADVRRVVAVGGGARTHTWLQIVSDISGEVQELPRVTVGASYGDAFLAGLAAGVLERGDLTRWVRPDRTVTPDPAVRAEYDRLYGLYRQLYEQTRSTVHALGAG